MSAVLPWPGRRAATEQWRIICPCQKHGGLRAARRPLGARIVSAALRLRRRAGTLLVSLPVALGVAMLPSMAIERVDAMQAESSQADSIRPVRPAATAVKAATSGPELSAGRFDVETVRRSFFATEIPYGAIIYREAQRNNLPPELVAAVVQAESDFRAQLISEKDARGLMQVVPSTGEFLGASDLMDPGENVRVGTRYLRYLLERYRGNQQLALAAYNAGEGVVDRFGGIPPYTETRNYVVRVASSRLALQRKLAMRVAEALLEHQDVAELASLR